MNIILGTDHAGFELKEFVKKNLIEKQYNIIDCGAMVYTPTDDYPDFIKLVIKEFSKNTNKNAIGIIFGASGQGEAIVANRNKNIRAVVLNNENLEIIELSRKHNNANVLSIGARFVSNEFAITAIEEFINTTFSFESRHKRRIDKIDL